MIYRCENAPHEIQFLSSLMKYSMPPSFSAGSRCSPTPAFHLEAFGSPIQHRVHSTSTAMCRRTSSATLLSYWELKNVGSSKFL